SMRRLRTKKMMARRTNVVLDCGSTGNCPWPRFAYLGPAREVCKTCGAAELCRGFASAREREGESSGNATASEQVERHGEEGIGISRGVEGYLGSAAYPPARMLRSQSGEILAR
ncbi:MAG: hypothetical protein NWE76_02700, partial [Candidatus Bathyarchaeota archaeon]|nr:hypothetical protein [Candidatus Bathyarchaeota archaeon]